MQRRVARKESKDIATPLPVGQIVLIVGLFLTMLLLGWVENIRGPAIPLLRLDLGVSYRGVGLMLSSYSLLYFLTVFLAGMVAVRFGRRTLLLLGYLIAAAILPVALLVNSYLSLLLMMGVLAVGLGIFEIVLNAAGADVFPRRTAFMMNLLHLFYGLGAVIGPVYAGLLFDQGIGWRPAYAWMAVAFLVVLPVIVFGRAGSAAGRGANSGTNADMNADMNSDAGSSLEPGGPDGFGESGAPEAAQATTTKGLLRPQAGRIVVLGLLLGGAMTFELAVAAWLVNFLVEVRGLSAAAGAGYLGAFFAFFSLGRLIGGIPAERVGYLRLIEWFLLLGFASFIGLVVFPRAVFLAAVLGFFISILFPTVMAVIIQEFRGLSGAVMGIVIPMAGALNMISGPLLGAAHDYLGVSLGFSLIGSFALLGLLAVRLLRRTSS
ncbi:MAG: MFS transporter [Spirochaetaceae bacterium]|nr:MAG: MFS transporter [Spirochaetaceae bacterium]